MKSLFVVMLMAALSVFGTDRPSVDYRFDRILNNVVPNQAGNAGIGTLGGKYTVTPDGGLLFNGVDTVLTSAGKIGPLENGITFTSVWRRSNRPLRAGKKRYDALFFRDGQFAITLEQNRFYTNFYVNGKWRAPFHSGELDALGDGKIHHCAVLIHRHRVVNQGEDWVEVKLYFDGQLVGTVQFRDLLPDLSSAPLELFGGERFGKVWRFEGEVRRVKIYNRLLSEREIRQEVAASPGVLPAFRIPPKFSASDLALRDSVPEKWRAAVRQLSELGRPGFDWRAVAREPEKFLRRLEGPESTLTLLNAPGVVRLCSWFDRRAGRELLAADNTFQAFEIRSGRNTLMLTPDSSGVVSRCAAEPKPISGGWSFAVEYHKVPDRNNAVEFRARTDWKFYRDRIEFVTSCDSVRGGTLVSVNYPEVRLRPLDAGKTRVLIPRGGGVAHRDPELNPLYYSEIYTRGVASMQLGALYDGRGGVYFAAEDPFGVLKFITVNADADGGYCRYRRPVPRSGPDAGVFRPHSRAALELFRGDWYDAGMIYRRILDEIGALWWRHDLPNTDTPRWLRDLTWSMIFHYPYMDLKTMVSLRRYLGLEGCAKVMYWWGGDHSALAPIPRVAPDCVEFTQALRKEGIRIIPYGNGRIWANKDRRGEDWGFTRYALPAAVIENGAPVWEFHGTPCVTLCPATETYRKFQFDQVTRNCAQWADGYYLDQIGAGRPWACESDKHGHPVGDPDMWYRGGYLPVLRNIRKFWKERGEDKVLSTEDNAETCVGVIDVMVPWRWMYANQVPLYPLVYAGRTQFFCRDSNREEPEARFVKAAVQIANSEQIGSLKPAGLLSPINGEYRRFIKQLIYLRHSMLDFFNRGMMLRPVQFRPVLREITRLWGIHGDRLVNTLEIVSSAWEVDGVRAVLLINPENVFWKGEVSFPVLASGRLLMFGSDGSRKACSVSAPEVHQRLSLPPRGCGLLLVGEKIPKELEERTATDFQIIARAGVEPDPQRISPADFHKTPVRFAGEKHAAVDSAQVRGAGRNREGQCLNWIQYGLVYAGLFDFGGGDLTDMVIEAAAPKESSFGTVSFCIDDYTTENAIAVFPFFGKFFTDSWSDFRKIRAPLRRKISGIHKVFIRFDGNAMCNLRSWRAIGKKEQ